MSPSKPPQLTKESESDPNFGPMPPKPAKFDEVREITSGLKKLLNTHSIHAPDNTRYWCIMHDKQNNNRVTVFTGAFIVHWMPGQARLK